MSEQVRECRATSDPLVGVITGISRFLAIHFWKVLAVAVATGLGYVGTQVITTVRDRPGATTINTARFREYPDLAKQWQFAKQKKPGRVILKDKAGHVAGYFGTANCEYIFLQTVFDAEHKMQTAIIPWENVEYIEVETEVPTVK